MLRRARSLAAALSLLVSFALPAHAGVWPNTPYTSVALTSGGNAKLDYQSVADGQGGMFMTWVETVGATYEVFVQHASATGQLLWGPLGLQITNVAGNQTHPLLVPDGSGGLLVE